MNFSALSLFCYTILLVFIIISRASSYKVAILPAIGTSHTHCLDVITQQLIKRGHETITITSNEPYYLKKLRPSPLALYEVNDPVSEDETYSYKFYNNDDPVSAITFFLHTNKRYCDATLSNKTLMQSLRDVDIIVGNAAYVCSILVPEVLQKPFINVDFSGDIFGLYTFYGRYRPASYIPNFLMFYSPKLSFWQRLGNTVAKTYLETTVKRSCMNVAEDLRYKHNISTHLNLDELGRKMSMYVTAQDFAIEIPRPLPPYFQIIGPLQPQPASPLPQVYEDFIQSSQHGTILICFGSELRIKDEQLPEILKALTQLPYQIIWKTSRQVENIPSNIKISRWVPQNDILGHNKTVVFVTHCGANSLYEAAYHGVPIMCMPAIVEQHFNSIRVVRAGIGIIVDRIFSFKADDIINGIKTITSTTKYKDNAKNISKIIKSNKRLPRDKMVDLIEYTMETNGAHHLKAPGETLWLYEHYNLDVYAFVIVIIYIVYRLLVVLVRYGANTIFPIKPKKKSD